MRKFKFIYFYLLALSIIISACNKSSTTLVGNWVYNPVGFSGTAREFATCFTIQDTAYVCTGLGFSDTTGSSVTGNTDLVSLWAYFVKQNSWERKANFPKTGRHGAVSFSIGNKGYMGTGYYNTQNTYFNDFWEYDPQMNTWTQKKSFGGTPRAYAIGFALGNYGYIGTGFDGDYCNDFWRYDPSTDAWTQIFGYGGSNRQEASVFILGDTAYICCGVGNSYKGSSYIADFWKFDNTEKFTRKRDIYNELYSDGTYGYQYNGSYYYNIERTSAVAFGIGSKGYVSCGQYNSLVLTTWEYDNTTDLWTQKNNFKNYARIGAVAFTLNNRGFVTTGGNYADMYEFKPYDLYNAGD